MPKSRDTPSASNTSALPVLLDMLRLPCLATVTPAPAMTNAEVVLILKLCEPSPPVPQLSMTPDTGEKVKLDCSRITSTSAAISSAVSPLLRKATRNAASSLSEACPEKPFNTACFISCLLRFSASNIFSKYCFISLSFLSVQMEATSYAATCMIDFALCIVS